MGRGSYGLMTHVSHTPGCLIVAMSPTKEEKAWCVAAEEMKRAEPWWPTSRTCRIVSNSVSCCGLQVWADVEELLMRQTTWLCNTCSTKPHTLIQSCPWRMNCGSSDSMFLGFGRYDEPTVNSMERIKMKAIPSCLTWARSTKLEQDEIMENNQQGAVFHLQTGAPHTPQASYLQLNTCRE